MVICVCSCFFLFFKQKTAYEMRISDWSSDVCSSDLSFEAVVASVYALFQFDEPPVHLIVAPLTHAAAIFHYALLPRGGTQILLSSTDPLAVLEAIQQHRVSVVYLPPTLIYMVLAHPRLKDFDLRSEEHTSELQSLMRISYAVFCLKKKKKK